MEYRFRYVLNILMPDSTVSPLYPHTTDQHSCWEKAVMIWGCAWLQIVSNVKIWEREQDRGQCQKPCDYTPCRIQIPLLQSRLLHLQSHGPCNIRLETGKYCWINTRGREYRSLQNCIVHWMCAQVILLLLCVWVVSHRSNTVLLRKKHALNKRLERL